MSQMIGENAARRIAADISSATAESWHWNTSRSRIVDTSGMDDSCLMPWLTSVNYPLPSTRVDPQLAVRSHHQVLPGENERGGVELHDDGGPLQRRAGQQVFAPVHIRGHCACLR